MDDYYGSLKRAHSSSENDSSEVKARRLEDGPHSRTLSERKSRLGSECRAAGQEKDRLSGRSKHSEERNQQHERKNREEKETRQQSQNQRKSQDKKRGEKKTHTNYDQFVIPTSQEKKNNRHDKGVKNRP